MYVTQCPRFACKYSDILNNLNATRDRLRLAATRGLLLPPFGMNTRPETFVPLIHCFIDDILSKAIRQTFVRHCLSS